MTDAFLQVQPDANGKQVDMSTVQTTVGNQIYRQRAEIIGDVGDALQQMLVLQKRIVALLSAIVENQGLQMFNQSLVSNNIGTAIVQHSVEEDWAADSLDVPH